jgi:hypothetical protein
VTDERLIVAIGRLDQALTRLESAVHSAAPSAPAAGSAELTELRVRHERLKGRTQEAVAALDRLIGSA